MTSLSRDMDRGMRVLLEAHGVEPLGALEAHQVLVDLSAYALGRGKEWVKVNGYRPNAAYPVRAKVDEIGQISFRAEDVLGARSYKEARLARTARRTASDGPMAA